MVTNKPASGKRMPDCAPPSGSSLEKAPLIAPVHCKTCKVRIRFAHEHAVFCTMCTAKEIFTRDSFADVKVTRVDRLPEPRWTRDMPGSEIMGVDTFMALRGCT